MISLRRRKIVIAIVLLLAAAAMIAFAWHPIRKAVCFALLSPAEKKAVGEWTSISISGGDWGSVNIS